MSLPLMSCMYCTVTGPCTSIKYENVQNAVVCSDVKRFAFITKLVAVIVLSFISQSPSSTISCLKITSERRPVNEANLILICVMSGI